MSFNKDENLNISEPSPRSGDVLTRLKEDILNIVQASDRSVLAIGGYYRLNKDDPKEIANRAAYNLVQALDQIEGGVGKEVKKEAINQLDKALKAISDNIENLDIKAAGKLNDFFRDSKNNKIINDVLSKIQKGTSVQISKNINIVEKNCKERLYPEALKFSQFQQEFNQTFLDSTCTNNIDQEKKLLNTVLEDLEKNTDMPKDDVKTWKAEPQQKHTHIQKIFNAIHEKIEAIAKNKFGTAVYDKARIKGEITYTRREPDGVPKRFMMDALDPLKKLKARVSTQAQPNNGTKAAKN